MTSFSIYIYLYRESIKI